MIWKLTLFFLKLLECLLLPDGPLETDGHTHCHFSSLCPLEVLPPFHLSACRGGTHDGPVSHVPNKVGPWEGKERTEHLLLPLLLGIHVGGGFPVAEV